MSVRQGLSDPEVPGGEHPGTGDRVPVISVPFGSVFGHIGLMSPDTLFDGLSGRVQIDAVIRQPPDLQAFASTFALVFDNVSLDDDFLYDGVWLYLHTDASAVGAGDEGVWYQVDHIDTDNASPDDVAFVITFDEAIESNEMLVEVNDLVVHGMIRSTRDLTVIRPKGSAKYDRVMLDTIGADGLDSGDTQNELEVRLYSQEVANLDDLTRVATTQVDETQRTGNIRKLRLGYDTPGAGRGTKHRMRIIARTRAARIEILKLTAEGKEWNR